MKAVRALRRFTPIASNATKSFQDSAFLRRLYSAQSQQQSDDLSPPNPDEFSAQDSVFDSSHYDDSFLNPGSSGGSSNQESNQESTWDDKYRDRVKSQVFGENVSNLRILQREEEKKRKAGRLANELLGAALDEVESEDEEGRPVTDEEQKSLAVGIIGAPNAGKSALTNSMVGTKVSAVSRKTNTTTHEVLGVMTKGDTQICFFDTPGLMLKQRGFAHADIKIRNESAWSSVSLYDVLIVVFDVQRHITRPDTRVVRLIERMGSTSTPNQKRILCINKVDLVEKKKDLVKVVEEFSDLSGYERRFLTSGVKGAGVKDLTKYLMEQAVQRPWDEDPFAMSEEVMKNISLEIVREKMLDHVHQEVPYAIEHRLMSWKELRDGSLRIEQHFITPKKSQRGILVGKNGCKIRRIGMEANEELRAIFKRNVHLIVTVNVKVK